MSNILTTLAISLAIAANTTPQAQPAKAPETAAAKKSDVKYCLTIEAGTGSRLAQKECRTRTEWAKLGVNIDKPNES
jgi:hypothetical protein